MTPRTHSGDQPHPAEAASIDRRRAPRMDILGRLHGHIVSLDVAVRVREMSIGGLSMETPIPFPLGATHQFQLVLGDGTAVQLSGRVVRCARVAGPSGQHVYVSGVQFVDSDSDQDADADDVIDRL